MSRNSKRKWNKHSKKGCGKSKTVSYERRRSTKRKRCRSNKKLVRKLKRILCTICYGSLHGVRRNLKICGHVFHKNCINKWLKYPKRNCPNCRKNIPRNTGLHHRSSANPSTLMLQNRELLERFQNLVNQIMDTSNIDIPTNSERPQWFSSEIRIDSSAGPYTIRYTGSRDFLTGGGMILPPYPNQDNLSIDLEVPSPNFDNLNTNLDDRSSDLVNSNIDLVDSTPGSDDSNTDSDNDSSPNFDNPSTDSTDPDPNLDISAKELPRPSP